MSNKRGDLGPLLERGDGQPLDPDYDGTRNYSWNEIVELISAQEGQKLGRQAVMRHVDNMVIKLREKLINDPVIRDWILDNDLEKELYRDPKDLSQFGKSFLLTKRAE
jgi:hypothetical protein